MGSKVECPECGKTYKQLGQHWTGSCSAPQLTKQQYDIVVGLLMGDGNLRRNGKNPHIKTVMISPNYLEYLDEIFGCLSTGIRLTQTAAESAQENKDSGFRPNAKEENYSDLYQWRTRNLPELHDFNWYKTGKKVWPEDIELTPTVLKHWYCGDGHFDNYGRQHRVKIAMANEVENTDKVDNYFKKNGLPLPSGYDIYKRTDGGKNCEAYFTRSASEELWEYMGDPLPDFKYKWPESHR